MSSDSVTDQEATDRAVPLWYLTTSDPRQETKLEMQLTDGVAILQMNEPQIECTVRVGEVR